MKLKVVLEKAEEGGYTVYIPALPGCISEGETKKEALANIKDALKGYLAVLNKKAEVIQSKKHGTKLVEVTI